MIITYRRTRRMASFTQKQKKHIARTIRIHTAKFHANGDGIQHLAHKLNVSPSTVSNWAQERRTPRLEHLYQMSKLFSIPLHQLCGLPKPPPKHTSKLASDIIVKIASCKTTSGKTLFHSMPLNSMEPVISLILNELNRAIQFHSNTETN